MIKSVIFDLDGTLINSMGVWGNVDREFVEKYGGIYTPEISEKLKSMTIEQSSRFFIDLLGLDKTVSQVADEVADMVSYQYKQVIELKENANEITAFLQKKNIPFCVATATYKNLAKAVLQRHGIYERFQFMLTGEDVAEGKTSPKIYLECAERMKSSPSETLVVEDALHCIETTVKAGFYTVGIYEEFNIKDWDKIKNTADDYIYNLDKLKKFF